MPQPDLCPAPAEPPDEAEAILVPAEARGERLDRFVMALHPQASRAKVQAWIEAGWAWVDRHPARKAGQALKPGQLVVVLPPPPEPHELQAEALPLALVHQDADLVVVDKAAGMVVHPAAGHSGGTLVNALLHHFPGIEGVGAPGRPGLVHRLDKDTSGLMVVALREAACKALQAQLADRSMGRIYLCVVVGRLKAGEGRVDAPIARDPHHRLRMGVVPGGRHAATQYRVLAEAPGLSFVACRLETGRTHQIRVHLASLGHPLAGDRLYGAPAGVPGLPAQALHAWRLKLRHPSTGEAMAWESPLPEAFGAFLRAKKLWPEGADWLGDWA